MGILSEKLLSDPDVPMFVRRFMVNVWRINKMWKLATTSMQSVQHDPDKEDVSFDIFRATVVISHATLEELLRGIGRIRLPQMDEECLSKIPFVGTRGKNPEKWALGKLAAHRDRTVNDLILDSVNDYLNKLSFNSIEDVTSFLDSIEVDYSVCRRFFPDIALVIKRRHQIVHEADLKDDGHSPVVFDANSILQIENGLNAVFSCCYILVSSQISKLASYGIRVNPLRLTLILHEIINVQCLGENE